MEFHPFYLRASASSRKIFQLFLDKLDKVDAATSHCGKSDA